MQKSMENVLGARSVAEGRGLVATLAIASACLPVLGATSVAPIQPAMAKTFADQAGVEVLVAMVLTIPALVIGLTALFAGRIIDALGRKRVMISALILYSVFGTSPIWLETLQQILVSRVLTGIAEAAIFTCAMALIADNFIGRRRAKYYGLMTITTGLSAVVFFGISGALGAADWRHTFWLYAASLPLAILAIILIPSDESRSSAGEAIPPVDWKPVFVPILFALATGITFYAAVVMLAFRLEAVGVQSPATIGLVSALGALTLASCAAMFSWILSRTPWVLLPLAFIVIGIGLVLMGFGNDVMTVSVGAVVANAGAGLLIPTSQNWILQHVGARQRGRASGAWSAAIFVGEFLSPLIIFGIASQSSLGWGLVTIGMACLVLAALGAAFVRLQPNVEEPDAA